MGQNITPYDGEHRQPSDYWLGKRSKRHMPQRVTTEVEILDGELISDKDLQELKELYASQGRELPGGNAPTIIINRNVINRNVTTNNYATPATESAGKKKKKKRKWWRRRQIEAPVVILSNPLDGAGFGAFLLVLSFLAIIVALTAARPVYREVIDDRPMIIQRPLQGNYR
jgi:hypothetical protein